MEGPDPVSESGVGSAGRGFLGLLLLVPDEVRHPGQHVRVTRSPWLAEKKGKTGTRAHGIL